MILRAVFLITLTSLISTAPACGGGRQLIKAGRSMRVTSICKNGICIWTFTNLSGTTDDGTADYDILAWSLQPFGVRAPSHVQAPDGWRWVTSEGGGRFEVVDKGSRYAAGGPALEPGESLVFIYTPDPKAPIINAGPSAPARSVFIVHVGAVESAQPAGAFRRWRPAKTSSDIQWYEAVNMPGATSAVPEPPGILAVLVGVAALAPKLRGLRD